MKIRSHSESHVVELEDGSTWQIFPGDVDITLDWRPETDLTLVPVDDDVCSRARAGPPRRSDRYGRTVDAMPTTPRPGGRGARSTVPVYEAYAPLRSLSVTESRYLIEALAEMII
jgi:hypothetical protein